VSCFGLPLPEEMYDQLVRSIVSIENRSRDHMVAVIAAYDQIFTEYHVKLDKLFGHKLLGLNERISVGVTKYVQAMSIQDQFHD